MKAIPDGSIDFICTDMPYGSTKLKWDAVIPFEPMWAEFLRIAKPNACIALFAQAPFDKMLAASKLDLFKYEIIYEKPHPTNYLNSGRQVLRSHENVLIFYRKQPTFNPQMTEGHPRKVVKAESRKGKNSEIWNPVAEHVDYDSTQRFPRSVLKFTSDKYKESLHPTQKPVALVEYLLRTFMNPNSDEIVLDACAGSGTIGVAAINTGVNFLAIEKEEHYVTIARERIEKHRSGRGG